MRSMAARRLKDGETDNAKTFRQRLRQRVRREALRMLCGGEADADAARRLSEWLKRNDARYGSRDEK